VISFETTNIMRVVDGLVWYFSTDTGDLNGALMEHIVYLGTACGGQPYKTYNNGWQWGTVDDTGTVMEVDWSASPISPSDDDSVMRFIPGGAAPSRGCVGPTTFAAAIGSGYQLIELQPTGTPPPSDLVSPLTVSAQN
jgi:hypothetical protein